MLSSPNILHTMAHCYLRTILITLSFVIVLMSYSQTTLSEDKGDDPPPGSSDNLDYYLEYLVDRKTYCCKGNNDIDQPPSCCTTIDSCFTSGYEYPHEDERICKPKGCYTNTKYSLPVVVICALSCVIVCIGLRKMMRSPTKRRCLGLIHQDGVPWFPKFAWGTDEAEHEGHDE